MEEHIRYGQHLATDISGDKEPKLKNITLANILTPLGPRVVIEEDEYTHGYKNIVIPKNAERRPTTGKVVAIGEIPIPYKATIDDLQSRVDEILAELGDKVPDDAITAVLKSAEDAISQLREAQKRDTIRFGDRVLYAMFAGTPVSFKDQPALRVLNVDEILAKVNVSDSELSASAS